MRVLGMGCWHATIMAYAMIGLIFFLLVTKMLRFHTASRITGLTIDIHIA